MHSIPFYRPMEHVISLASFPGVEEGEEKERLVHTVCTCSTEPVATVFLHVRMYTGDIKTCHVDVPVGILFE